MCQASHWDPYGAEFIVLRSAELAGRFVLLHSSPPFQIIVTMSNAAEVGDVHLSSA
jgi:hypothetical protein